MPLSEIHLAGAYGIPEILAYNADPQPTEWNFPYFFPFRRVCPQMTLRDAAQSEPNAGAMLLVINLNPKVWEAIQPRLGEYGRRVLIQMEAYEGWEIAYQQSGQFDAFLNFDTTRGSGHPGFERIYLPYDPEMGSSHRDRRGLRAWLGLWRHSKHQFVDLAVRQMLPRRKKAVMIAALGTPERYQIRLRTARRWPDWVDVYGRGWPKDLPNYRGVCISKLDVLKTYRYALVFENQPQPGYVTEKLLDPFLADTVPLYHGAPDATHDLPSGMFIPFADENAPLDRWIRDDSLYRQVRTTIKIGRATALARYSTTQFIDTWRSCLKLKVSTNGF